MATLPPGFQDLPTIVSCFFFPPSWWPNVVFLCHSSPWIWRSAQWTTPTCGTGSQEMAYLRICFLGELSNPFLCLYAPLWVRSSALYLIFLSHWTKPGTFLFHPSCSKLQNASSFSELHRIPLCVPATIALSTPLFLTLGAVSRSWWLFKYLSEHGYVLLSRVHFLRVECGRVGHSGL